MRAWILAVLFVAGCVAPTQTEAPEPWHPAEVQHDHHDPLLHLGRENIDFVAWSDLGVTLGANGFANFVMWNSSEEDLAFVAMDGDTEGGFAIVDIADPLDIRVLGTYWVEGNSIQEVRVTPDGRFAVMNVQDVPQAGQLATPAASDCTVCIHVVDIQDRTAPELASVFPVELLGTHNMDFVVQDGVLYLYYVGQPLYLPYPDPGNHVYIARFEATPTGAHLVPVRDFTHNQLERQGRTFPHDVVVQRHPLTGQDIAYVSHWDGGAVLFDVSDPLNPVFLAVEDTVAPSDALAIHWTMQEGRARADGRVIAWSVPEIGVLETGTGVLRAYDVTDPTDIGQVGTWTLPGEAWIPGAYIFSPHTAVPHTELGLVAVTHYHAGLWVVTADPEAPQTMGYYQPHGDPASPYGGPLWWKKPNFNPDGYGPNVYQARWDREDPTLLWVTDRGTGLYALRYTGPVPGPV